MGIITSDIEVSTLFKNTEAYICNDIKYIIADLEGSEQLKGLAA